MSSHSESGPGITSAASLLTVLIEWYPSSISGLLPLQKTQFSYHISKQRQKQDKHVSWLICKGVRGFSITCQTRW